MLIRRALLGVTVLVQGQIWVLYLILMVITLSTTSMQEIILEVSYTGYSKLSQNVSVGSSDVTQDLQMSFSASELDEML